MNIYSEHINNNCQKQKVSRAYTQENTRSFFSKLSKVKLSKVKERNKFLWQRQDSTRLKEAIKQKRSKGKMLDRLISVCHEQEITNKKLLTWMKTERDQCTRASLEYEITKNLKNVIG